MSATEQHKPTGPKFRGQPFWQRESYDHWVRSPQEFDKIKAYIENNPVKTGLVAEPEQFPWSSAGRRKTEKPS